MDKKVELLAPAGNMEGFFGAIHAGADAVYLGGQRFGARAYADNFTTEELLSCIRYAHLFGRRVYLTVNTLIRETEYAEVRDYIKPFYEGGLDGVIVQDIGVCALVRKYFPELALHVSTQMTLTGKYGAKLLRKMGAVRVVPARELSLAEIVELKATSGLQVETFIHGAMCYCYSGQCLFSSMLGGRSGNRGRCAQPCRLPYRVERGRKISKECYPLSLKDMCTIEHLPELIEAGIDSFKIEGRMKKPEYAAGVTAVYRKYIDRYYAEGEAAGRAWQVQEKDLDALAALYIRSERQDGYYSRRNGRDMVTLENPSYGKSDEELLARIRERYLSQKPKKSISVQAKFQIGQPARVSFSLEHHGRRIQADAVGEVVLRAEKQPVTEENIKKQLGRLGETGFQAKEIEVRMDADIFYSLKAVNELRRQAVTLLENALIADFGLPGKRTALHDGRREADARRGMASASDNLKFGQTSWHVSLRSREQLEALAEYALGNGGRHIDGTSRLTRIYLEADSVLNAARLSDNPFFQWCGDLAERGCELVMALPYILRKQDEDFLECLWDVFQKYRGMFSGFLARSMEGLGYLAEKSVSVYGDAGLYVWNQETLNCLEENHAGLDGFCLPYELKAADQRRLLQNSGVPAEKVVYGRIPLMITANCIVNTMEGCGKGQGDSVCYLNDRYRKRFPVYRDCSHCMNIIYNSVPLSLHGELAKWRENTALRLHFTLEDAREMKEILQYFVEGAQGAPPYEEYTTGHEKRGAE